MTELYNCPLCGASDGYVLDNGSTHRWYNVICKSCAEVVTECRAQDYSGYDAPLPVPWQPADVAWNEAADYAHRMKIGHDKWIEICKHFLGACHD